MIIFNCLIIISQSISLSSLDSEEQESLPLADRIHNRSSRNSTGGISTHSLNEAELAVSLKFESTYMIFILKTFSGISHNSPTYMTVPRQPRIKPILNLKLSLITHHHTLARLREDRCQTESDPGGLPYSTTKINLHALDCSNP